MTIYVVSDTVLSEIVKPASNHPWSIKFQNQLKLKAARKEAERRRLAKYYQDNKEHIAAQHHDRYMARKAASAA